jgi:lipid II:glycine glycyltransferase (peptidoglycan interpeptide bridge formation enzyme)
VAPGQEGLEALSLLLQTYNRGIRGNSLYTELRNNINLDILQPVLQRHQYAYEEHLNYLIDLARPAEAVFHDIGPRTRKNIRRTLNRGQVQVEAITEKGSVVACYELLRQTYQKARVPLADQSLFEAAFDILFPRGRIRFTLAKVNGVPIATSVDLLYKKVIFGWYGGVNRDYSSYAANEILTWEILKWGAENGYHLYDFGGAGQPDKEYGVRDFKAKFGGRLVCFGRNSRVHSPLRLRLSTLGYAVFRPLFFGMRKRQNHILANRQDPLANPRFLPADHRHTKNQRVPQGEKAHENRCD